MRLIDADAVIKAVDRHTKDESEVVLDNDITCILEEVPTAYDMEGVVAELNRAESVKTFGSLNSGNRLIPVKDVINIVKAGGVK